MSQKRTTFVIFVSTLAFALLISGCGSGNTRSSNTGDSGTPGAQGFYLGTQNGETFEAVVLPNDQFYALHGVTRGNLFLVAGMMAGQGRSNAGSYTATGTDYTVTPVTGTLTATYTDTGMTGTITGGGLTLPFSAGHVAGFNFHVPATLSYLGGSWIGTRMDGSYASLIVDTTGAFQGSSNGCTFTGTLTPDPGGNNFFNLTWTFGAAPCQVPNLTLNGIAFQYVLSTSNRQLAFAANSTTTGDAFVATR